MYRLVNVVWRISMSRLEEIVKNTVAYGRVIINAGQNTINDVSVPVIFVIEDEVYIYAYCNKFGTFAYGNTIDSAKENLIDALGVNFSELYKQGRIEELFNPLDEIYDRAWDIVDTNKNKRNLILTATRFMEPESTFLETSLIKQPDRWTLNKKITISVEFYDINRDAA